MDFNIEFETKSDNIIFITKQYFIENKFKLKSEFENKLVFIRGNAIINMFTFNPLKWKSIITIIIENNTVNINAEISTVGQIVTNHEVKLWKEFFGNFKKTIINNVSLYNDNKKSLSETKFKSFKLVLKSVVIVFVVGAIIATFKGFVLALF